MTIKKLSKKQLYIVELLLVTGIITVVTGLPYLKRGLTGFEPDLLYHLLRIEGVKEALVQGNYPTQIYELFFGGYGYGSPLFYPDIFLLFPALLRLIGVSPIITWKIFVLCVCIIASLTTYFSFRYMIKDHGMALAGTVLLMLSQFYLADIIDRVGVSSYISYIFVPVLLAGIYDYFENNAKRIYLIGIAFCGLLLTHTIMTFIGAIVMIGIFFVMLFSKEGRERIFSKSLLHLIIVAIVSFLSVSFYLLPMLEQMVSAKYQYTIPTFRVAENTQPINVLFLPTGYFDTIAYVGIGIPILLLLICRIFYGKPKNKWADYLYFGGLFLFFLTTSFVPWGLLQQTIFNKIQFTYRFYPYALCCLIIGIMMLLKENLQEKDSRRVITVIFVLGISFGIWQNITMLRHEYRDNYTESYIEKHSENVGEGQEWLPVGITKTIFEDNRQMGVICGSEEIPVYNQFYNGGYFDIKEQSSLEYILPKVYYKGYEAVLTTSAGKTYILETEMSDMGLVKITNYTGETGKVKFYYQKTTVQKVSMIISVITWIVLIVYLNRKRRKNESR